MLVKDTLEKMASKLLSQSKVNNPLVNELKSDIKRLNDSYLYINGVREDSLITKVRNKDLEGYLISQRMQIMDLEKRLKEGNNKGVINEKLASDNIRLESELEELEAEVNHLRELTSK